MLSMILAAALPVLQIGWSQADITPKEKVFLSGMHKARVSEGVQSPLTTTALCFRKGETTVVFVSCDLINISDDLREAVTKKLNRPDLHLLLHATHNHTAPRPALKTIDYGVKLEAMSNADYLEFASGEIVKAIETALKDRKPGSVAFGVDEAVIGRNRRWVDDKGKATMYGLGRAEQKEVFRHIEGYEDHSVNLLATYDESGKLRGVVINVAMPSQKDQGEFLVSADFWHEARQEIRKRFGNDLFILPQCATAGDQAPFYLWGNAAHKRMLELRNRSWREEIAVRIANAVGRILPVIEPTRDGDPAFQYQEIRLELPLIQVKQADVDEAESTVAKFREEYEKQLAALPPEAERTGRWYVPLTRAWHKMRYARTIRRRFEKQGETMPLRLDLLRLGDIAFVTMPFEVYLDYGIQIKVRSPFIQNFLVQLAGSGGYLSSPRAEAGKGYGSNPASNPISSGSGQMMTEAIVKGLRELKPEPEATPEP